MSKNTWIALIASSGALVFWGCAGHTEQSLGITPSAPNICELVMPTAAEQLAIESELATRGGGGFSQVTVPVYFHIITDGIGTGNLTDVTLTNQISIMNAAYAGSQSPGGANTSFRFVLAGTDRTANAAWFTCLRDSADEVAMKAALRRGSGDDLNVYVRDLETTLMGYGTFPWLQASSPQLDSLNLDYTGMPGGSSTQFNQGDLMVHEAGHWLGLYHTFQDGCSANNDYISDTPAEAHYNWNCPVGTIDTCTGAGFKGTDPTMNFMDYTNDACKYQFTREQNARMEKMWTTYRAGK